jgi:bis(5'-nucleosyl)-tetraphosphatase (symmetrical)
MTIRTCDRNGIPSWEFSGPPEEAPDGLRPWFAFAERRSREATILFGHWAALGFRNEPGVVALDSGCVWGGTLTAVRLPKMEVYQEEMGD